MIPEFFLFFSSAKRKQQKADYDVAVEQLKSDPQIQEAHEKVVRYQAARRRKMNVLGYILATVAAGALTEVGKNYFFPSNKPVEQKMVTLEYEGTFWKIPTYGRDRIASFLDAELGKKTPASGIVQKITEADKADGKQDAHIGIEGLNALK